MSGNKCWMSLTSMNGHGGMKVKAACKTNHIIKKLFISTDVICIYCICVYTLHDILNDSGQDILMICVLVFFEVTWNACMTACSNGQMAEVALHLFEEFEVRGNVSTVPWTRIPVLFQIWWLHVYRAKTSPPSLSGVLSKKKNVQNNKLISKPNIQLFGLFGFGYGSSLYFSLSTPDGVFPERLWPMQPSLHVFQVILGSLHWTSSIDFNVVGLHRCQMKNDKTGTNDRVWVLNLASIKRMNKLHFLRVFFSVVFAWLHLKRIWSCMEAHFGAKFLATFWPQDGADIVFADRVSFNTTLAVCAASQAGNVIVRKIVDSSKIQLTNLG